MPKVTGYKLREAIKRHTLLRDTSAAMFKDSLKRWPGESKSSPDEVMEAFYSADIAIARLQVAQMQYNLAIRVKIYGSMRAEVTLAEAVKRLGGTGRCEKMWRSAATPPDTSRYGYDGRRDKNEERAESVLSLVEAARRSNNAASSCSQLREAIAVANSTEIEIEDLDESLLQ